MREGVAGPEPEAGDEATGDEHRPRPRTLTFLLVPIVLVSVLAPVADALTTTWAGTHPLALVALNARTRILVLATNQLDPVSYYVAGTLRLLLTDPLWFLIGYLYGDRDLAWARRRS